MKTLASSIIDFTASYEATKPPFKAVVEPSSPAIGEIFTVTIYAPEQYTLFSPYNGILSGKTPYILEPQTEIVNLQSLSTDYPVSSITSANATNPLVNTDTRTIEISAWTDLMDNLTIQNSALKSSLTENILGSASVDYATYIGQQWEHSGFDYAGEIILFAQNDVDLHWENIPVSIAKSDAQNNATNGIEIALANESITSFGMAWNAHYMTFVVLGAKNPILKTDYGSFDSLGKTDYIVTGEEITLDGSGVITTKWPVDSIKSFTGIFYDKNKLTLNPNFIKDGNGKILTQSGAFGKAICTYITKAFAYNYFVEKILIPVYQEKIGTILALDGEKSATFVAPKRKIAENKFKVTISVVYSVVVSPSGTWELPPGFSNNPPVVTYPGYSFPANSLLDRYAYPTQEIVKEIAESDYGTTTLHNREEITLFHKPFIDYDYPNRVYSIKKTIPKDINIEMQNEINRMELILKAKYNIA